MHQLLHHRHRSRASCTNDAAARPARRRTSTPARCCTTICSSTPAPARTRPARVGSGAHLASGSSPPATSARHCICPSKFGYHNNNASWNLIYHLVNRNTTSQSVYIEMYHPLHRPRAIRCGRSGWTSTAWERPAATPSTRSRPGTPTRRRPGPPPSAAGWSACPGTMHDVDITGPGACTNHCPTRAAGIAVSAELVGGSPSDYYGPNPPNGTRRPRHRRHDLPFRGLLRRLRRGTQWRGHLDTVSRLRDLHRRPGRAHRPRPIRRAAPGRADDGYQDQRPGQSRSGCTASTRTTPASSRPTRWGSWSATCRRTEPGYPRPKAATPMLRVAGAGLQRLRRAQPPCTRRRSTTPRATRRFGASAPVDGRRRPTPTAPRRTSSARRSSSAVNGQHRHDGGRGGREHHSSTSPTSARRSDLTDYTGQLQLRLDAPDHRPQQRPGRGRGRAEHRHPGHGPVRDHRQHDGRQHVLGHHFGSTPCTRAGRCGRPGAPTGEMAQVQVFDGGADGLASTSPNTLFAMQGVFVP